ncbi:hypothetical protein LBMAG42_48110 [Deltaproteobacteria bacterium]|nr:hypothetical protein LBMAG42_48110 [Deltaproteobacteria bacterium]
MLGSGGWAMVVVVWLCVGLVVAAALHHRREPLSTALAAIPAWPLLLPVLLGPATSEASPRANAALERLAAALAEAGEPCALQGLREGLVAAETRLDRLDRLLAELGDAGEAELARVRLIRQGTASEIDAVLAEMVRLRVSIGLAALANEPRAVRAQLGELVARVRALEEVNTALDGGRYTVAEVHES